MQADPGHGGIVAAAAMGAWAAATAFWMGVGAVVWRLFFEPRIKELKASLETERAERKSDLEREREDCNRQLTTMGNRIQQLEGVLMMHGPQSLRAAMQASLSEQWIELRHHEEREEGKI